MGELTGDLAYAENNECPPPQNSSLGYEIYSQEDADALANCGTLNYDLYIKNTSADGTLVLNGIKRINGALDIFPDYPSRENLTIGAPDLEFIALGLVITPDYLENITFDSLTTVGALYVDGSTSESRSPLANLELPAGLSSWSEDSLSVAVMSNRTDVGNQTITILRTQLSSFPNITLNSTSSLTALDNPLMSTISMPLETACSINISLSGLDKPGTLDLPQLQTIQDLIVEDATSLTTPELQTIQSFQLSSFLGLQLTFPSLVSINGSGTLSARNLTVASFPELEWVNRLNLSGDSDHPSPDYGTGFDFSKLINFEVLVITNASSLNDLNFPSLLLAGELTLDDLGCQGFDWSDFLCNGTISTVSCDHGNDARCSSSPETKVIIPAVVMLVVVIVSTAMAGYFFWKRRKNTAMRAEGQALKQDDIDDDVFEDISLPKYDVSFTAGHAVDAPEMKVDSSGQALLSRGKAGEQQTYPPHLNSNFMSREDPK